MRVKITTIALLSLLSCGQKNDNNYQPKFQETFVEVALDTTSTWQQIVDAANIFADSLSIIAEDTVYGKYRLAAQEWGYTTIYLLSDLYEQKKEEGLNVNYRDIRPIIDRINDATSAWIGFQDDVGTYLYRDHFYNSYQGTENQAPGYFSFMVKIPKCDTLNYYMEITFPTTANKNYPPIIAFKNYTTDRYSSETDYQYAVLLEDEIRAHTGKDKEIVFAVVDQDVVDMMRKYDVMYVMFNSSDTDKGDINQVEVARVELATFQKKMGIFEQP